MSHTDVGKCVRILALYPICILDYSVHTVLFFRTNPFLHSYTNHAISNERKTQVQRPLQRNPKSVEMVFETYFWDFYYFKMDIPHWIWFLCKETENYCKNFCIWHRRFASPAFKNIT